MDQYRVLLTGINEAKHLDDMLLDSARCVRSAPIFDFTAGDRREDYGIGDVGIDHICAPFKNTLFLWKGVGEKFRDGLHFSYLVMADESGPWSMSSEIRILYSIPLAQTSVAPTPLASAMYAIRWNIAESKMAVSRLIVSRGDGSPAYLYDQDEPEGMLSRACEYARSFSMRLCLDVSDPNNIVVQADPTRHRGLKRGVIPGCHQRTRYIVLPKGGLRALADRAKRDPSAPPIISPHWRRAHWRRLSGDRWSPEKRGTIVPVRACTVGGSEEFVVGATRYRVRLDIAGGIVDGERN